MGQRRHHLSSDCGLPQATRLELTSPGMEGTVIVWLRGQDERKDLGLGGGAAEEAGTAVCLGGAQG